MTYGYGRYGAFDDGGFSYLSAPFNGDPDDQKSKALKTTAFYAVVYLIVFAICGAIYYWLLNNTPIKILINIITGIYIIIKFIELVGERKSIKGFAYDTVSEIIEGIQKGLKYMASRKPKQAAAAPAEPVTGTPLGTPVE